MCIKTFLQKLLPDSKPEENSSNSSTPKNTYIDLAPKKDADISTYEDALIEAIKNPRVYNIALTGPYGSGKSSIIETFEEKHDEYKFLNISLASFKEISKEDNKDTETTKSVDTPDNQTIEKSILQQMIYSQDSDALPYSRFKRINKPKRPLLKSIAIITWAVFGYFLNLNIEQLHDFSNLNWYEILALTTITFGFIVPAIFTAAALYKRTYTMSIKSISLTNTEISQAENSEESILNKYLDEILYFFEETNYKVVVIEDLDRFGGNEIFIKLREINKLINSKKSSSSQIKFLYAIKDNMFSSVERSKFFEFIIPVIPIVNTSNSTDMMINHISENGLHIDKNFIKDIGLYINDQRLINNIFNEFKIYTKK